MKHLLIYFALACFPLIGNATLIQGTHGSIYTPSGGSVLPSSMSVSSAVANDAPLSFLDITKKGVITFGVDHHYPRVGQKGHTTVTLSVSYHTTYGGSLTTMPNFTMELDYNPEGVAQFADKQIKELDGVVDFTVTIVSVTNVDLSGTTTTTLPANLYLNADIFIDRIYDYSSSVSTPISLNNLNTDTDLIDSDCDGVDDQLLIKWTKVKAAEEYQLEWTFVNDYTGTSGIYKDASQVAFDFKNNSTRVVTADNQYKISLIYDHGYIIYRIRAVGRNTADYAKRIYSVWSTQEQGTVSNSDSHLDANNYYHNEIPWEYEKNWQYSASFAEEGKRKEVVSFFDGTLRNRQMVTIVNTTEKAIVGETIYDHMGRPVIQVLPTPVANPSGSCISNPTNSLKFYKDFNQVSAGNSYTRKDFDKSPGNNSCILTSTPAMYTGSGSSNYYSSSNPNITGANGYIPKADGYPFSQVEYTPDNTGRIRRQGGVGQTFQLGSGHETKYYYAHPDQIELDRLFGMEVGIASHYQKNMVVDPNGQVSVSYLDQEGRVIATALAGVAPSNLSAVYLDGPSGTLLTSQMIVGTGSTSSNLLSTDGKSKTLNTVISISYPTDVTFNYLTDVPSMLDECVANLCFNCAYDLTFEVKDECGNSLVPSTVKNLITGYFSLDSNHNPVFDFGCGLNPSGVQNASTSFTLTNLPVGTYTVTKTLTVSAAALAQAEQKYLDPAYNSCVKTLADFNEEYLAAADYSGCDPAPGCEACVASLGSRDDFIAAGGSGADFDALVAECRKACEPASLCEARRDLLLMDVSPNGQYGEYLMPDNSSHPENFPLSVYNTDNHLPRSYGSGAPTLADWQTPKYELGGSSQAHYYKEDLTTIAYVPVEVLTFNGSGQPLTCSPAVNTPATNVTYHPELNSWAVEPQYLTYVSDFIFAFKQSWAYSLIYYHPEYNFLKTCLEFTVKPPSASYNNSSEDFDNLMQSTTTWQEAVTAGFIRSDWNTPTGITDPFNNFTTFTDGTGPVEPGLASAAFYDGTSPNLSVMSQFAYKLSHYQYDGTTWYSAAQIAAAASRCGASFGTPPGLLCYKFGYDAGGSSYGGSSTTARDADWNNFKAMYYSIKQQLITELSIKRSIKNASYYGYNECIDNTNFNMFDNGFLDWSSGFWNISQNQGINPSQPCSYLNKVLYEYKERRFNQTVSSQNQNPDTQAMLNAGNYNQYLLTGDCPVAYHLERLIDEMASTSSLTSSSVSLLTKQEYTGFALSLQNPISYSPLPNNTWSASTTTTQLSVNILNTSSAVVASLSMTQTAATPAAWNTVVGIANFHATSTGGLGFQFTADLQVPITGGMTLYPVTGSTTYDILNCTFDDVCERNDVGSSLYMLFNGLISQNKLAPSSAYQVRGGGVTLEPLVNNHLQLALGSTSGSSESWNYASGVFSLTSSASGSNTLNFTVSSTVPSGYTTFGSILSFSDFVVTGNNTFQLVGTDGTNTIRINLTATKVNGSVTTDLAIGSCEPPTLTSCTDQEVDNFSELEALLSDVLVNQNQPYDLFASSYLTDNLISQMEPGMTSAPSTNSTIVVYDDGLSISPREFLSQTVTVSGSTTTTVTLDREVTAMAILIYTTTETCVTDAYGETTCTIDNDDPPTSTPRSSHKVNQTSFDLGDGCSLTLQTPEDLIHSLTIASIASIQSFDVYGSPDDFGNYHQFIIQATAIDVARNPYPITIIGSSCIGIRECTEPSMPAVTDATMPQVTFVDPCTEAVTNMAYSNAANAYQQYLDSLLTQFRGAYIAKCMNATESLTRSYTQKEYLYTLYYYDQAGNLVKTVPPEGVEPLAITSSSDALELAINSDRTNGTQTVVTSHRMATTYAYNSLNQLTAQHMPDMDDMDNASLQLANGLAKTLVTTAVQMVSVSDGYLAGYVSTTDAGLNNKRGYLYRTSDGGLNWTRIENMFSFDLLQVRMATTTTGFAIGKSGTVFRTVDGGDNWDLLNIHSLGIVSDFVDVAVKNPTSGVSAAFLLGDGRIVKYLNGTLSIITPDYSATGTSVIGQNITDINSGNNYEYLVTAQVTSGSDNFSQFFKIDITGATPTAIVENTIGSQWNTIRYSSSTEGVVGGPDGDLLILSEGSAGAGTQLLHSSSNNVGAILETAFCNKNIGAALIKDASANIYLYSTTDGGVNWTKMSTTTCVSMCVLSQTGTSIQVVASFSDKRLTNYALTSGGYSQTWTMLASLPFDKLSSFNLGGSNYLMGSNGISLFKSAAFTSSAPSSMGTTASTSIGSSGVGVNRLQVQVVTSTNYHTVILRSNNTIQDVYYNGSAFSTTAISASGATYKDFALNYDGNYYVLAFDQAGMKVHRTILSTTAGGTTPTLVALINSSALPSVTFEGIGIHNSYVTLVGSKGTVYSSTIAVSSTLNTSTTPITWTDRSVMRLQPLRSITKASFSVSTTAYSGLAVGESGTVFRRATSTTSWELVPVAKMTHLNAISFGTINTSNYIACVAGDNTTAFRLNTVTSAVTDFTITPAQSGNYTDIGLVPVSTLGTVYMSASTGKSYYTADVMATTPTLSVSTTTSAFAINGLFIAPNQSGTPRAVAVGNTGKFLKLDGTTQVAINTVFGPSLNSVHFANVNTGTVVGDNYFVRTTTNAGTAWTKIYPSTSTNTTLVQNINEVYTNLSTNGSHFALLGGANYLAKIASGTVTDLSVSGTVNDIVFVPQSTTSGFLAVGSSAIPFTLTASGTTNYTYAAGTAITSTSALNAIYAFPNGGVIGVGSAYIGYRSPGATSFTNFTGSMGAVLNDVYFPDLTTGYIVGNGGAFYKTESVTFAATNNVITGISWLQKQQTDTYLPVYSNANINAISFPSKTKGVWGGSYTTTPSNPAYTAYVRIFSDEMSVYSSRFYYDRLGRIVLSQNSRQQAQNKYSYTLYDFLGRAKEAGEKTENAAANPQFASIFGTNVGGQYVATVIDDTKLSNWLNNTSTLNSRKEVTTSYYDYTEPTILSQLPITLNSKTQRKRIVHVTYEEVYDGVANTYDHATHYDYDIHGNVKTILQDNQKIAAISDIAQHRFKEIDYVYDLISGNVHRVDYQTGKADQWHHAYEYDGDNRIVNAYTTTATPYFMGTTGIRSAELEPTLSPYWDKEAEYSYYDHGPLARTVLGEQEVQGLDYVYTLQGWVKGVNSESLSPANDPGMDGYVSGSAPLAVAQDAYGYSLEYYTGDYATVNSGYGGFLATKTGSGLTSGSYSKNLYNGNIARMVTSITDPNSASNARTVMPLGSAYLYDQLNRLTGSRSFSNLASNAWGAGGTVKYLNTFTYDLNGNILSQNRQDDAGNTIDNLLYGYQTYTAGPNNGKKIRNRLYHVDDLAGATPAIDDDIEDMGTMANAGNVNTANNYSYDQQGRLIKDNQEQIYFIDWRVDSKVRSINSGKDGGHSLKFDYDAMGHRIAKHVYTSNFDTYISSVYYILDAQGNTMATYERIVDFAHSTITFAQTEKHVYASTRLGVMTANIPMLGSQNNSYSQAVWTHTIGQRVYELQNHLGNVLSIVTDKPIPVASSTTVGTLLSYFVSDIQQSTAYSAFGVQLNAHNLKKTSLSKDYRYGFQNQEEDDEIKGEGNSLNFEYRMHDPRLGRFFTIDPLAKKYPFYSPYTFAGNQVIYTVELEGLEPEENLNDIETVSIDGPRQGKSGDQIAWSDGGFFIARVGSDQQARNFAELMNLSHSLKQGGLSGKKADKGYESTIVISKDHELGIAIIESLKKNHNIDFNDLTRKQKKALLRIQWKEGEDRSDLFYYRPSYTKLGQIAIPIPTSTPVVIPSTGEGVGYGEGEVGVSLLNLSSDLADAFYHSMSKVARGRHRDTEFEGLSDEEFAEVYKGEMEAMKGQRTKEQKARKRVLDKEQKVRNQRNSQKKGSEKGTGTGRR